MTLCEIARGVACTARTRWRTQQHGKRKPKEVDANGCVCVRRAGDVEQANRSNKKSSSHLGSSPSLDIDGPVEGDDLENE